MNIPKFWAEGSAQHLEKRKKVSVRRFGWSATSEAEAQANADARAAEALRRILTGEQLHRREPKSAYNGAEGVPIREEIVAQHGATVITRNGYGALCLNTPDVLFADVDFPTDVPGALGCGFVIPLLAVSGWVSWNAGSLGLFFGLALASTIVGWLLATLAHKAFMRAKGGPEQQAMQRINDFVRPRPEWRVRLYRTPAGLRALAMHRPFAPGEPAVTEFFNALRTDPVYVTMCQRQQCFRARVTAKPWRIGITSHLTSRSGVWPVAGEKIQMRRTWVDAYHEKAKAFAACQFVSEAGTGGVHEHARQVQRIHDQLCRADTGLPIA